MSAKTPIRTVFDGSNNATGLAEFQSGEFIALTHGGLGASLSIGSAGQVLKVNSGGNALEFGAVSVGSLDIDAQTDGTSITVVDSDKLLLSDGGTEKKINASQLKTYIGGYDGAISTIDIDGGTDIGAALADADLLIVDDGAGGTNRKTAMSRVATYIQAGISGDITISSGTAAIGSGVIVNADINNSAAIAVSKTALTAGTGISLSTNTLNVDAAQTGITSLLATDIKIGEDNQTKIDFETADEIHFYAANAEQVYVADGVFGPQTDSDVDLGTTSVRWKDAYIDSITTTGNISVGGNLTVNGTTTTVNSTTVTIDDPIFTLGGDGDASSDDNKDRGIEFKWYSGSSAKLGFFGFDDSTGKFTFIPDATNSSEVFSGTAGTIVASTFEGNLTGNVTGNVSGSAGSATGNAATATALENARTIAGQSFDGTGNITIASTDLSNTTAITLNTATQTLTNKTLTSPTINAFSGTGNGSIAGTLSLTSTSTGDVLNITTTENSSTAGPTINLKRNSGSVADADYMGQIKFVGENDADQEQTYAKITGKIQDASDGSEDGLIEFANVKAGSQTITARLRSDKLQLLNSTSLEVTGDATITGDVDVDGTLEADAITVNGTTLAETISDTIGAMVTSNTESGIAVTYDDSDNTLDFTVGTLNQNTTGSAATLTTARTIAGQSFDGSANIAIASTDLSNTSAIALLTSSQTLTNKTLTSPQINTQVDFLARAEARFQDASGGQYVALEAPATVSSSVTFTLPAADGSAGQVIKTDGSGALSFTGVAQAGFNQSTLTIAPGSVGDFNLAKTDNAGDAESGLTAGATDDFGVAIGSVFDLMEPTGNDGTTTDFGAFS